MMMFSVVVFVGDVTGEKSIPEARRASHTLYQRSCIEDRSKWDEYKGLIEDAQPRPAEQQC